MAAAGNVANVAISTFQSLVDRNALPAAIVLRVKVLHVVNRVDATSAKGNAVKYSEVDVADANGNVADALQKLIAA